MRGFSFEEKEIVSIILCRLEYVNSFMCDVDGWRLRQQRQTDVYGLDKRGYLRNMLSS